MIISRLTLYNFGVYAGKNTFEFHNEKPIVLIGGLNGRGKTTFLEAVLIALYGINSFAFNESEYKSYGQYLKSFVNKADGTLNTYVELEIKLDRQPEEVYVVNRKWSGAGHRIREKITVYRNGEHNTFLTDNWSMFIENILPSGLSSFFFFDGEKIAELALDQTNSQMKESIKALLGISILDVLENDITRIISRIAKKSEQNQDIKMLAEFREKKKQVETELREIDEQIDSLSLQLDKTKRRLQRAKADYTNHGGDIVSQQQELFNQRAYLSAAIIQQQEHLVSLAGGELPLRLVVDLLQKVQLQAQKEHESKMLSFALKKVSDIFSDYSLSHSEDQVSVENFVSYIANRAEEEKTVSLYNLSDKSLFQIDNLLSGELNVVQQQTNKIIKERDNNRTKIDQIDHYLSIDIDEKSLAKTYKKIKSLEQKIIDIKTDIDVLQKQRATAHGEVLRVNSEYKKCVETLLEGLESNDDQDRVLKYAHQAIDLLNEYRIRLQRQKINILAATMTRCYKMIANKKNLIKRIEMDDVTLDFSYYDYHGNIIPNSSLSAGERQLMVISLLWALAICSKKELPVIIDTPLSRMDSNHRVSLITTYFPQAGKQTIILSTDSEIDRRYYNIMKENIGDEFTLVYDDTKQCSVIQRGYLIGDKNVN